MPSSSLQKVIRTTRLVYGCEHLYSIFNLAGENAYRSTDLCRTSRYGLFLIIYMPIIEKDPICILVK